MNPENNTPAIELTMAQKFEIEKWNRTIDECNDMEALKSLTKQLAQSWMIQKAATIWVMKNQFQDGFSRPF